MTSLDESTRAPAPDESPDEWRRNAFVAPHAGLAEEAHDWLRRALTAEIDLEGLNDLAVISHRLGRNDEAKDLLRAALVIEPERVDAATNLAAIEQLQTQDGWRGSNTLGGTDPNMYERAFPGMPRPDIISEHCSRYAFALSLVGGARGARPRVRHRLRQRDALVVGGLGARVRSLAAGPARASGLAGGDQAQLRPQPLRGSASDRRHRGDVRSDRKAPPRCSARARDHVAIGRHDHRLVPESDPPRPVDEPVPRQRLVAGAVRARAATCRDRGRAAVHSSSRITIRLWAVRCWPRDAIPRPRTGSWWRGSNAAPRPPWPRGCPWLRGCPGVAAVPGVASAAAGPSPTPSGAVALDVSVPASVETGVAPAVSISPDMPMREYWHARAQQHTADRYLGIKMSKFPEDLRVYEQLMPGSPRPRWSSSRPAIWWKHAVAPRPSPYRRRLSRRCAAAAGHIGRHRLVRGQRKRRGSRHQVGRHDRVHRRGRVRPRGPNRGWAACAVRRAVPGDRGLRPRGVDDRRGAQALQRSCPPRRLLRRGGRVRRRRLDAHFRGLATRCAARIDQVAGNPAGLVILRCVATSRSTASAATHWDPGNASADGAGQGAGRTTGGLSADYSQGAVRTRPS